MKEKIKNFFEKYKLWLLLLIEGGILIDIFVIDFPLDFLILLLTGLWVWLIRLYKFEAKISIGGGLIFLSLCPFLVIFNWESTAEKAAIWAYIFLIIGIGQLLIGCLKENRE